MINVLYEHARVLGLRVCQICMLVGLVACSPLENALVPISAQPKTPVARNVTSFGPSLHCMDTLLLNAKRRPVRITSTQVPDRTKLVSVGANDMVINALNQMNRKSNAFIFIDQAIIKSSTGRLLDIEVKDTKAKVQPLVPEFYIRGSISQLDRNVRTQKVEVATETSDENLRFDDVDGGFSGGQSVVTVDLHLVAFPSRQVLPGASVSNAMVVTQKRFSSKLTGEIAKHSFGVSLQFENMESTGQAVRNLIELGVIELLGRYSNVPYWECLALESTNSQRAATQEREHALAEQPTRAAEAQALLVDLGRLSGAQSGKLDQETRRALAKFQAERGLLANGEPDFDTLRILRLAASKARTRIKPVPKVRTANPAPSASEFQSINVFLDSAQ